MAGTADAEAVPMTTLLEQAEAQRDLYRATADDLARRIDRCDLCRSRTMPECYQLIGQIMGEWLGLSDEERQGRRPEYAERIAIEAVAALAAHDGEQQ